MAIGFGWDIGGAHLKAACLATAAGRTGRLLHRQVPFELYREPERLAPRLTEMVAEILRAPELADAVAARAAERDAASPSAAITHAVTMTGEMCDVYPSRRDGVRAILAACVEGFGGEAPSGCVVLDVDGTLLPWADALENPGRVAAANWMATAGVAARFASPAVLIDVGSTTTDIIPLVGGRPRPHGRTDRERLLSGELVYSGLLRTPPAAVAARVPIPGGSCPVVPEFFAQMADVYLLLGRIDAARYTVPAPDGRDKTPAAAAIRLARIVGCEPREIGAEGLRDVALFLERRQVEQIGDGLRRVIDRLAALPDGGAGPACVLTAGAGAFLAAAAAASVGLPTRALGDMTAGLAAPGWEVAAPSVALALLHAEALGMPALLPPIPGGGRSS